MDPVLKARVVAALRQAARDARAADHQQEANELVTLLDPPVPEGVEQTPDAVPPHDELRTSVQASTAEAERAAYERANA